MENESGFVQPRGRDHVFDNDRLELIWQMALASLASNDNEMIVPMHIAEHISMAGIEGLKSRLR